MLGPATEAELELLGETVVFFLTLLVVLEDGNGLEGGDASVGKKLKSTFE